MGNPDLLMKAKALAALEQGITTNYTKPIEALAAIADALGLEPDPAVLVLTEEEKAILNDALVEYYNVAIREAENLQRRGYEEYARRWIDSAQKTDSLRQRLAK